MGGLELEHNAKKEEIRYILGCRESPLDMKCCVKYGSEGNYESGYITALRKQSVDCGKGFIRSFAFNSGKQSGFQRDKNYKYKYTCMYLAQEASKECSNPVDC